MFQLKCLVFSKDKTLADVTPQYVNCKNAHTLFTQTKDRLLIC